MAAYIAFRTVKVQPEAQEKFENLCARAGIEYTSEWGADDYIHYHIPAEKYSQIEKFMQPKGRAPQAEAEGADPERKANFSAQLDAASERQGRRIQSGRPRRVGPAAVQPQGATGTNSLVSEGLAEVAVPDFGVLSLEEQKRLDEQQAKAKAEKKPAKKRAKSGRDNQVKTRLTDTEMKLFSERVKASGLKQGDFMRECLLHEEVHVRSLTEIDAQAFGKLMEMASDLGRIGGLIKGTVMTNKDEFGALTSEEKSDLEKQIRELNKLKEEIQKAVQMLYGNS